jgi:hypothetical protein
MAANALVKQKAPAQSRQLRPTDRVIAQLNERWRVVDAQPCSYPQWNLQRKKGSSSACERAWVGSAYCVTKAALSRNIHERCGPVDTDAMAAIDALPEKHPLSGQARSGDGS